MEQPRDYLDIVIDQMEDSMVKQTMEHFINFGYDNRDLADHINSTDFEKLDEKHWDYFVQNIDGGVRRMKNILFYVLIRNVPKFQTFDKFSYFVDVCGNFKYCLELIEVSKNLQDEKVYKLLFHYASNDVELAQWQIDAIAMLKSDHFKEWCRLNLEKYNLVVSDWVLKKFPI